MDQIEDIIGAVHRARDLFVDKEKIRHVQEKGAADYVTWADQSVQDYLEKELFRLTPDIQVFAEEKINEVPDPNKSYWILDPVDGTTNLIHDFKFSAVSLALYEKGKVTFGVVYNPFTEETYHAVLGKGSFLNEKPIHAASCSLLKDCLVSFGACPYRKEFAARLFPVYQKIFEKSADFRRAGSAALELCYVGAGRLDAYIEGDLKPWDYAAGQLIAREAGAVCTDFTGAPLPILFNGNVLACTPGIHAALCAELKDLQIP